MNTYWPHTRNRIPDRLVGYLRVSVFVMSYLIVAPLGLDAQSTESPFFIGTYTGGQSQGIYRSTLNLETGDVAQPHLVAELTNPSFLALHPKLPVLYAVSEVQEGTVIAYSIREDGTLQKINQSPTDGSGPCYVSTNSDGTILLIANYGSGSICAIRIEEDGRLSDSRSQVQHLGKSVHPRQKGPHAHCIQFDPSGRFVFAVDLGLDQVLTYRVATQPLKLEPTDARLQVAPGSGPRHLAFHPDGKSGYVLNELNCTVESFRWNAEDSRLESLQPARTTLPVEFQEGYSGAEILVHPNGKFIYVSNRGHHSITCLDRDLALIGNTSTAGKTPRNFRISPDGKFLLAENQDSDSVVVFEIDPMSGKLLETDHRIQVGSPVCIRFQPPQTKP